MELDLEAPADASMAIGARVERLRSEVARVARSAGRDPNGVTIVAISKLHPREAILEAYAAGIRAFGENYVQEAIPKLAGLPADAERHFVGHIQTNKAKTLASGFDLIHSVDRLEAGEALAKAAGAAGKRLRVLVQANVSPVERFGVAPESAPELAEQLRGLGLEVAGLMAIGPIAADRDAVRRAFTVAAEAHRRVGGPILSLGMSEDWPEAVACGSTMIRIGTAIFGPRGPQRGASFS